MKKVVILANHYITIYSFRKELVKAIIGNGCEVVAAIPVTEDAKKIEDLGCRVVDVPVSRRSTNPFKDIKLFKDYRRLLKEETPDCVLTFTIKPNIYGGMACRLLKIPYLVNITGLGIAMEGEGLLQNFTSFLYKIAMKKAGCIFFQNKMNENVFSKRKIHGQSVCLLPGSGVNLEYFHFMDMPQMDIVKFVYISRVMKEKGVDEYLAAAEKIKKQHDNTEFHILGFCEERYEEKLKSMQDDGIIVYHGMQDDVREYLKDMHCLIHPSYYPEGMSNVCLEAAACGRAVITTKRPGCKETVEDEKTGFLIEEKNTDMLVDAIERFMSLSIEARREMGKAARRKMELEFDRNIVIEEYLKRI